MLTANSGTTFFFCCHCVMPFCARTSVKIYICKGSKVQQKAINCDKCSENVVKIEENYCFGYEIFLVFSRGVPVLVTCLSVPLAYTFLSI